MILGDSRYKVYVGFSFASQKNQKQGTNTGMRSKSSLEATTGIKIGPVNKSDLYTNYFVIGMAHCIPDYLKLQSNLSDTDWIYFSQLTPAKDLIL